MSTFLFWLSVLFYLYLALTVVYLLLDNREPPATLAWLLLFLLLPVVGFVVYLFIGRNWRRRRSRQHLDQAFIEKRLGRLPGTFTREQAGDRRLQRWLRGYPQGKRSLAFMLVKGSDSVLTLGNRVELYHDGQQAFAGLLRDLESARSFIYMEYFIWRDDALTRKVQDILIARAGQGVRILILIDSFGSWGLPAGYIRELSRAGVRLYKFYNFLSPLKLHTLNYRNHRKLAVIDGLVAHTGGMNLGQDYIDGRPHFPAWRDAHMRIEGPAVNAIQAVFGVDWHNTTRENLSTRKFTWRSTRKKYRGTVPLLVTTSGPDSQWQSIKQLFFSLVTSAEHSVYIQTPYFIPDPSIQMALKTAAMRGCDVRLMVTGLPDKWLPYWSAFTYFEDLLQAGVRIFHYQAGFLHAKTIAVDSEVCSVGTANMDLRSFSLNYELATLVYDPGLCQEVERQFLTDQAASREFTPEDYQRLSTRQRLGHSLARLLAPIL